MRSHRKQMHFKNFLFPLMMTTVIAMWLLFHSGNPDWNSQAISREKNIGELAVDKPVEREVAGGHAHLYQLTLTAGQYLQIAAEQSGIDLTIVVFDPEGKEIRQVNLSSDSPKPQIIYLIAKFSGAYRLEMRASEKAAMPGRYKLKVEALRIATRQDERRFAWYEIFAEGTRLKAQATAESLRAAILKYQEALHYLRDADELAAQAETLSGLGEVYYDLGEIKKALETFLQELPLRRTVGDRSRESAALNHIGAVYDSLGERRKALEYLMRSLELRRTIGDRDGEAITLNNIGNTYRQLGDPRKAIDYYNQSLLIMRALGNRRVEAYTLNNIGATYEFLGERQKALDYLTRSLAILRAIGDRRGEAGLLNNRCINRLH